MDNPPLLSVSAPLREPSSPPPYFSDSYATLYHGDNRDLLPQVAATGLRAHAIVTDPPYELGFMGKKWDKSGVAFDVRTWKAAFDCLLPGGWLLAFGGTRTYHRMACAIEDAGFEIRDQIGWLYGSGFPKSLDVSKAIDKAAGAQREVIQEGKPLKRMIPGADQGATGSWIKDNGREFIPTLSAPATDAAKQWEGWGTALKPAWEPIVVARKPLIGTMVENIAAHGCGALNIDASRIETFESTERPDGKSKHGVNPHSNSLGSSWNGSGFSGGSQFGRFPANIIHDGSDEVLAEFAKYGDEHGGGFPEYRTSAKTNGIYQAGWHHNGCPEGPRNMPTGSAARFFYCAKASGSERGDDNDHPTVKPLDLMRYLCRMVTPPRGINGGLPIVLDPFCGSGTTIQAANDLGFHAIGMDTDLNSLRITLSRLRRDSPGLAL